LVQTLKIILKIFFIVWYESICAPQPKTNQNYQKTPNTAANSWNFKEGKGGVGRIVGRLKRKGMRLIVREVTMEHRGWQVIVGKGWHREKGVAKVSLCQ
jgi:hypothetical protein